MYIKTYFTLIIFVRFLLDQTKKEQERIRERDVREEGE